MAVAYYTCTTSTLYKNYAQCSTTKYKKGGHVIRKVLVDATYSETLASDSYVLGYHYSTAYTEELIKKTVYQCQKKGSTLADSVPQLLCSAYEHPLKETAVQEHRNRFTK